MDSPVSPLRELRRSKGFSLAYILEAMSEKGHKKTRAWLSLVERDKVWPSKESVNALVEIFDHKITELEILYPFDSAKWKKRK